MLLGKFPDLPLLVKTELFHSDSIECRTCTHSLYVYIPQSSSSSLLKVRNVKHEEPQVFFSLLLAGINKLGNNLIHDLKLHGVSKYLLYSEALASLYCYTLCFKIYKDALVTCSTVLVMDMEWIFFRVFLWKWFEILFRLQWWHSSRISLDYNITSDPQTIHCYSLCNY